MTLDFIFLRQVLNCPESTFHRQTNLSNVGNRYDTVDFLQGKEGLFCFPNALLRHNDNIFLVIFDFNHARREKFI